MTNIVYLPRTTIQVDPDRADITRMQTKLENAKLRYRLKKKEMMHKMSGGTIKKNEAKGKGKKGNLSHCRQIFYV